MARIYQSASSYGLASWMRPQQGGLPIQCGKKIRLSEQQITEAVFLCAWIIVLQKYMNVV